MDVLAYVLDFGTLITMTSTSNSARVPQEIWDAARALPSRQASIRKILEEYYAGEHAFEVHPVRRLDHGTAKPRLIEASPDLLGKAREKAAAEAADRDEKGVTLSAVVSCGLAARVKLKLKLKQL